MLTTLEVCCAGLLLVCAGAGDALGNPLDEFGFGSRAIGLGGAATAVVDDVSANYYNPAALANIEDLHIDIGYSWVEPFLEINGADLEVDESSGVFAGLILPTDLWGHTLSVSLAFFFPDKHITRVRALPQSQPRFVLYDNRPQRIVITSSVGFEVIEDLFLGLGLTYVAHSKGGLELEGLVSASNAEDTELLTAIDVSLESARYVSAGVLWTPGKWRFGASFRDEFFLELDLTVDVGAGVALGDIVLVEDGTLNVRTINTNLFTPRQFTLGAAFEEEDWLVSFDLTWLQWGNFPSPTAVVDIIFDLEPLALSLPPSDVPINPGFHDIVVPRFGAEGQVFDSKYVDITIRGGYFYEPTPAPDQLDVTNYVDSDRHGMSVGTSLSFKEFTEIFPKPIIFDIALQYIVMASRDYEKDDVADPVGDYSSSGQFLGASFTTKFLF